MTKITDYIEGHFIKCKLSPVGKVQNESNLIRESLSHKLSCDYFGIITYICIASCLNNAKSEYATFKFHF